MEDLAYGYCGMPCALCSRYRTEGSSRCPGCSQDGYYTESCKIHRCCREKGLDHCGLCGEYPCPRLQKMGDFSDLCTGRVWERDCARIAREGMEPWSRDYRERDRLLTEALARYNNGRMKRYLCELFIARELSFLRELLTRAGSLTGDQKSRGKAFRALAEELDGEGMG